MLILSSQLHTVTEKEKWATFVYYNSEDLNSLENRCPYFSDTYQGAVKFASELEMRDNFVVVIRQIKFYDTNS